MARKTGIQKKLLVSRSGKSGAGYCDGNRRKRCGHRQCPGNAVSPDYGVTTYHLGTDINGVTSYASHVFRSPLAVLFALLSASAMVTVALIGVLFHFFVGNVWR